MELTNDFRVGVPIDRAWDVLIDVERIAPCMPGAELQEVQDDEYRGTVKVKVGPITATYKGKASFIERDDAAHRAVLRAEGRETRGQGNANATITASLTADGEGTKASVVTDLAITGRVAQFGRGVLADVSTKLLTQFVECLEQTVLGDGPGEQAAAPTMAEASGDARGAVAPETGQPVAPGSSGVGGGSLGAETAATPTGVGGGAAAAPVSSAASSAAGTQTGGPATEAGGGPRTIAPRPAEPVDLVGVAGGSVLRRVLPALAVAAAGVVVISFLVRRRRAR
ncbi:MAG TPA: SRPBCC family protein [Acidimicrobiales bacterium]|jgi:carbon monoxide dehydrogenase subunit G|nr:SRPBCC family protein [Acidimicrobiales bacterium]